MFDSVLGGGRGDNSTQRCGVPDVGEDIKTVLNFFLFLNKKKLQFEIHSGEDEERTNEKERKMLNAFLVLTSVPANKSVFFGI